MLHDAVQRRLSSQETFLRAAELALRVTSASGAAVAINRRGQMLCRAATGKLAPPVGARLAAEVGISSQFVGGGKYLHCDDTEKDFRVDRKACRNLGIRSVVVVPVQLSGKVVAILEIFGEKPGAFAEDQVERLQSVADMVAGALLDRDADHPEIGDAVGGPAPFGPTLVRDAAAPALDVLPPEQEESRSMPSGLAESQPEIEPWRPTLASLAAQNPEESSWLSGGFRLVCFSFVFAMVLVAVVFGSTRIYQHTSLRNFLSWRSSRERADSPPLTSEASGSPLASEEAGGTRSFLGRAPKPSPEKFLRSRRTAAVRVLPEPPRPNPEEQVKAETHPEPVGRLPASSAVGGAPSHFGASQPQFSQPVQADPIRSVQLPASSQHGAPAAASARGTQPLPSGLTGGRLIHRVEPEYPASARLRRLEGAVTLRAVVAEDGTLQNVGLVSGNPALAVAAAEAVGQWRYEPYSSNGQPVRVPIQITVEFKLPGTSAAQAAAR